MTKPLIKTARLYLRPFIPEDVETFHAIWNDSEVRKFLWDDQPVSIEIAQVAVRVSIELFENQGFGMWVMIHKADDTIIGSCGFRFFADTPEIELLYAILPTYWGQGLTAEAARAVVRYAFEELGFERIIGLANVENAASLRVMEKAGMKFEKHEDCLGEPMAYYAISRHDFEADDSGYILSH
jgi:RimJ/RimL family protein N-acetyltransferase